MSLSFISSSVLTSTDGVSHNVETAVEETSTTRAFLEGKNRHGSLYDQLRTNQMAEEEKQEEISKSLRGTRTLDEEDVAHLNAMAQQRQQRIQQNQAQEDMEIALFQSARAERQITVAAATPPTIEIPINDTSHKNKNIISMPTIIVKKKKRKQPLPSDNDETVTITDKKSVQSQPLDDSKKLKVAPTTTNESSNTDNGNNDKNTKNNSLGGLLCCYDSDDSDSS